MFFAITSNGRLYALDTAGNPQPWVFGGAAYVTTVNNATGLAFHPWMSTLGIRRRTAAETHGHGVNQAFDLSRNVTIVGMSLGGRTINSQEGGASYYFGVENWTSNPSNAYFDFGGGNSQLGF